jgi:GT2 family glycosyltransferase
MDLSIIIVNWNTAELLVQCLESVYKNGSRYSLEVIVVDNGSSDGSPSLVAEKFPDVILIRNDQNLGFAPANNQGLCRGTGRYFMLLNSDTIVLPGVFDAMIQLADEHPDVGVLGPKLLNMDNTVQESWASFPSFLSELLGKDFRVSMPVPNVPNAYDVDIVKGACMLVRSETIADVGQLDGDFFFYSEEIDWCYRIKKKNWRVWYLTDIEIYHLGGGSTQAGLLQLVRLYRGKLLYFNKHHGGFRTTLLRYGLVIGNIMGVVRRILFFNWKNREASRNRIDSQTKLIWCLLRNQYPETGLTRTTNK